jgi:N-hydroxyarylamine O-acetyltransferase
MQVFEYLKRINISFIPGEPTLEALGELQKAHLISVPFENLDFHRVVPLPCSLNEERFYQKIVKERRGIYF